MEPTNLDAVLIGGAWVRAEAGTYPIVDPATGEVVGRAPECSPAQVRSAARAAREAFDHGPWPRLTGEERAARLREVAARFKEAAPGLVDLTIAETGAVRPVAEAQQVGAVALRQLVLLGEALVQLLQVGALPERLGLLFDLHPPDPSAAGCPGRDRCAAAARGRGCGAACSGDHTIGANDMRGTRSLPFSNTAAIAGSTNEMHAIHVSVDNEL